MENSLRHIVNCGQSLWLDDFNRAFIRSGALKSQIGQYHLKGLTLNSATLETVIRDTQDYDLTIKELSALELSPQEILFELAVEDIRQAADELWELYQTSGFNDGYVSLEVNSKLEMNAADAFARAKSLWHALNRRNAMIAIPATPEGIPVIRGLLNAGVNLNATLIFDVAKYKQVAEAYVSALEDRVERGESIREVESVASFSLGQIDEKIDSILDQIIAIDGEYTLEAKSMRGKIAIANAKLAYQVYKNIFSSERFKSLEMLGARPQRLLWVNSIVPDLLQSDFRYIDALLGENTISALQLPTLLALKERETICASIESNIPSAKVMLAHLEGVLGIHLSNIGKQLQEEHLKRSIESNGMALNAINKKLEQFSSKALLTLSTTS